MSPDVTVILSKMQNICLKPVQLVGGVVTCVIYFIVALICVLFGSFILLLFTFCHTGHTYLRVETIVNTVWLVNSHLDIFAPFSFRFGLIHIHDVCVYRLLVAIITASRIRFWRMSRTLQGVLFFVVGCWYCAIVMASHTGFKECLELCGGVLLFVIGCWLLGNRYIWL